MSYADRTADLPQQPDGIEEDTHDLPDPGKAAKRAHEFLCEFGDGIVDACNGKALYARDLEVLSKSPALAAQLQERLDTAEARTAELESAYAALDREAEARLFLLQRAAREKSPRFENNIAGNVGLHVQATNIANLDLGGSR